MKRMNGHGQVVFFERFHKLCGRRAARRSLALHATLKALLAARAPGLTPRSALEKLAAIQMLDVRFPTTDGRELVFARYTAPEPDQRLVIDALGWDLPPQPPPRITAAGTLEKG